MVVRKVDMSVLTDLTYVVKLSFALALKLLWATMPTTHHPDTQDR